MKNSNKVLKNDQNNHLTDQVEHFKKIVLSTKTNRKSELEAFSYKSFNADEVTPAYVRGYN